jgi:Regulator of chromosome condensation (RCC1) repeat
VNILIAGLGVVDIPSCILSAIKQVNEGRGLRVKKLVGMRDLILPVALSLLPLLGSSAQAQTLRVWGDDASRQISDAPVGNFKALASGGSINGLALRWEGTPVLWGNGPIGPPRIPDPLAMEKFRGAALGRDDAVLIRQNGSLAAFGRHALLTSVPAGSYHAVTVASAHAVAIADDGTLRAWGSDDLGLLNAPEGGPFTEVSARVLYSLALHEDGTVYGWGVAPIGIDVFTGWAETPDDPEIFYVPNQTFKAISAGNIHALAIRSDGTITGWGDATGGALQPPTHVRFKAVAAGWGFSIGLSTDGTLWGWGTPVKSPFAAEGWSFASLQGWTRYGDTEQYYVPHERFKSIAAAAFHVVAITAGP